MTDNEDFAIKNHLQGTSVENCRQPLLDMANKYKVIYMVNQFILMNGKEMETHLEVSMSFTIISNTGFDYIQHTFKNYFPSQWLT